jgi:hypothetical protein
MNFRQLYPGFASEIGEKSAAAPHDRYPARIMNQEIGI